MSGNEWFEGERACLEGAAKQREGEAAIHEHVAMDVACGQRIGRVEQRWEL